MDLRYLTDSVLLKQTLDLARQERDTITKLLHHLREIDRRKLFCDLRCSSLHDYCTRILGYSEGSAHRRIVASRLLADHPEIEKKIETGIISLMNIASAVTFFRQENIVDLEKKMKCS